MHLYKQFIERWGGWLKRIWLELDGVFTTQPDPKQCVDIASPTLNNSYGHRPYSHDPYSHVCLFVF